MNYSALQQFWMILTLCLTGRKTVKLIWLDRHFCCIIGRLGIADNFKLARAGNGVEEFEELKGEKAGFNERYEHIKK
jgi:hypothetical protein